VFCAQCGKAVRDEANFCQGCGAAVVPDPPKAESQASPAPLNQAPQMAYVQPSPSPTTLRFEFDRLGRGDLVTGIATFVLLISLFLPWYSADGFVSFSVLDVRGWMYLAFFLALAIIGYLLLRALWAELKLPIAHWQLMVSATGLNLFLAFIAFLAKPTGFTWSVGAFLSLIAGVAAVVGTLVRRNEPEQLPVNQKPGPSQAPFWTATGQVPQPVPARPDKSCVKCGVVNPIENHFCSTCGRPFS